MHCIQDNIVECCLSEKWTKICWWKTRIFIPTVNRKTKLIRIWLHRTSKEQYFFLSRYDENQTNMSNLFQCIKYRVSSVKVRLRQSFHFVSFYCYLVLLRANVSVAVVEYIEYWMCWVCCALFCLYVCTFICL